VAETITVANFAEYVGTDDVGDFTSSCLTAGHHLVDQFQGEAEVPTQVHIQAVFMCASEIFHRRNSPQGVTQFASMDGNPVRAAKDPMNAARELLRPYTSYGV
jgi:hypothetical protein